MAQKPSRRKLLAASGVTIGAIAGCVGRAQEGDDGERTIEWEGQGDEHATQDCSGEYGYWHWILTPGGQPSIDENAELTVNFADGTTETATGYRPGEGGGAVHFDVFKEDGGTVESAEVNFTGGGNNPVLTISGGECVPEEEPPEEEPPEEEPPEEEPPEEEPPEEEPPEEEPPEEEPPEEEPPEEEPPEEEPPEEEPPEEKKKQKGEVVVDFNGICYKENKGKGQFRIENHGKNEVTLTWKVLGTMRTSTVTVPKRSSKTIWVDINTDQKLGLYYDGNRIATTKVHTQPC